MRLFSIILAVVSLTCVAPFPGLSADKLPTIADLQRENQKLREENDALKQENQTLKKLLFEKSSPVQAIRQPLQTIPQPVALPTGQAPTNAAQYIRLRSTHIVSGVAKITLRNNNPFPVRNISLLVKCIPTFRSDSERPGHTFYWLIEDLIMPGTDYIVEAIDANDTRALVGHGGGSTNEWIPTIEILRLEVVKP